MENLRLRDFLGNRLDMYRFFACPWCREPRSDREKPLEGSALVMALKRAVFYRMPESARALCNIVSLTAAKTSRMFDVSVAWVRLSSVVS